MTLRNLDSALGGYYVSAVSGDTDESGQTAEFSVRLRSEPTDNITIYVSSSDTGEGTTNVTQLGYIRRAFTRIRGGDIDRDVISRLASETDTELCSLARFIRVS